MRLPTTIKIFLIMVYEILVVASLVIAVRWLSDNHPAPLLRGAAFLLGMSLFMPPLMLSIYLPYRRPGWLSAVQNQGLPARGVVLVNTQRGDYWRPQDFRRYVRLTVRVELEGKPAYQASLTCRLDQAQGLQPGAAVLLRCDPTNPQQVALSENQ